MAAVYCLVSPHTTKTHFRHTLYKLTHQDLRAFFPLVHGGILPAPLLRLM